MIFEKVEFVDHGYTETISIKDLYPIHERFLHMPLLCYKFRLFGVKINEHNADQVQEKLLGLNEMKIKYYGYFRDKEFFHLLGVIGNDSGKTIDVASYLIDNGFC